MSNAFYIISLLPWQSTTFTLIGWATLVLFFFMIWILLFRSKMKDFEDKLNTAFHSIFCVFVITAGFGTGMGISLLVDVELGWKLSLLAGASVGLGAVAM